MDREEVERKTVMSQDAFLKWRQMPIEDRAKRLHRAGELLLEREESLARAMSREMGKPIAQSRAEIQKCAWVCRYYSTNARDQLKPRVEETGQGRSHVRFDPLGTVLAIMPWNYPFWQVFRFAAPSLMAGNTCLLKHAPNVWICAQMIEELFDASGLPTGVFQNLFIEQEQVADLIASPLVKAVTLTGSTRAGAAVGALCGQHIKPMVLELGGNNPMLVFPDADLDLALDKCIEGRFQNTGQSCIAVKRLLLHKQIAPEFIPRLIQRVGALISGDPMDPATYIGVLARTDLADHLYGQMQRSLGMGAVLACGGRREGTYFQPTVLLEVTREMPVFREETFGPLLGVTIFSSEEEGIALAGDSDYGLGASVFTESKTLAGRLIPVLEEGAVFINDIVRSDPRLPFGGVKQSGVGRELSTEGIRAFVNTKTVYES